MSINSIRENLRVSVGDKHGRITRVLTGGDHADIEFEDGTVQQGVHYSNIQITLHDGVFTSDETLEQWNAGRPDREATMKRLRDVAAEADRKRMAALANDAFDVARAMGVPDLPDEIKKVISDLKLFAPVARLFPTKSDTVQDILKFIEEATMLLATFFGIK